MLGSWRKAQGGITDPAKTVLILLLTGTDMSGNGRYHYAINTGNAPLTSILPLAKRVQQTTRKKGSCIQHSLLTCHGCQTRQPVVARLDFAA